MESSKKLPTVADMWETQYKDTTPTNDINRYNLIETQCLLKQVAYKCCLRKDWTASSPRRKKYYDLWNEDETVGKPNVYVLVSVENDINRPL